MSRDELPGCRVRCGWRVLDNGRERVDALFMAFDRNPQTTMGNNNNNNDDDNRRYYP